MQQYELTQFHEHNPKSVKHIVGRMGYLPSTVVEVGVYTGDFTFNMLHTFCPQVPGYQHFAIDPFVGYSEYDSKQIEDVYSKFQRNLSACTHKDSLKFIKKPSSIALLELAASGLQADLIYIDGDHKAGEVLQDMVLSWMLLKVGGAMLMDDSVSWCFTDKHNEKPLQYSPRLAVDSFIQCNWGKVEVLILPNGYQSAFIKRGA